jgi:hypothetical protein
LLGTPPRYYKIKKKISLDGTINNRGIIFKIKIKQISPPPTLLGGIENVFEGLMCVSKDSQVLEVMEREEGKKDPIFYEIKRDSDV